MAQGLFQFNNSIINGGVINGETEDTVYKENNNQKMR